MTFLPKLVWGGGPSEGWWRGMFTLRQYPSTTFQVVPLPICDGEEK
jgi:hypothetical protein